MERIADGDLTVKVKPRSSVDALSISFGLMAENLQGLVREMKSGASSLEKLAGEVVGLVTTTISRSREVESLCAGVVTRISSEPGGQSAELAPGLGEIGRLAHSHSAEVERGQLVATGLEDLSRRLNALVNVLRT